MRITPMPPTPGGVAMATMVSALTPCSQPTGIFDYRLRLAVSFSRLRVMCHCCAMDRTLFTVQ